MNKLKYFVLILPLLLSACPTDINSPSSPSPNQSASSNSQKSAVLNVIIKDGINDQIISNAQAKITLPDGTVLTKQTDNKGTAVFDNLQEGNNYNVEVSANNYINNSASTANISIKSGTPSSLTIKMYKSIGTFTGRVTSDSGSPINAAVVQVGNDSALSDANGNFKVNVSSLTQQAVVIAKSGYNTLNFGSVEFKENDKDKNSGTVKLAKKSDQISVLFDTSKNPFGNDGTDLVSSLSQYLSELNYKVSSENALTKSDLNNIDILVIASPSTGYSDSEAEKITNFVKQGKKLVVLGEWGGYSNFNADNINKVIIPSNLKINPDVIKETASANILNSNDEQILSTNIIPHFITDKVSKLSFYSSASVEIVSGGLKSIDANTTKLLAFDSVSGFRIQVYNKGQFAFMGCSVLGAGKVFVSGDSSIFTNDDSNSNNINNIDEHNNKLLIKNIFSW